MIGQRQPETITNRIRLYGHYAALSIKAQWHYRAAFALQIAGNFAATLVEFVGTWALLARFETFGGWGLGEVAILYGLVHAAFALAEAFGYGFDAFGTDFIRTGEFDRLLVRPRSVILQLLGHQVRLRQLGRFSQGLMVLIYGLWVTQHLSVTNALICLWCLIGGTMLFIGLFILQAALSFWTIESLEIFNAFTYGGTAIAQYPLTIFTKWIRWMITYVIPFAAITYFPALVITGRTALLSRQGAFCIIAPAAGFLLFGLALVAFASGIRRYTSAGG